jgi:hypothetical protein
MPLDVRPRHELVDWCHLIASTVEPTLRDVAPGGTAVCPALTEAGRLEEIKLHHASHLCVLDTSTLYLRYVEVNT